MADKLPWFPDVKGRCPACGTAALFLGDNGYVTCSVLGCCNPFAPSEVLGAVFQPAPEGSISGALSGGGSSSGEAGEGASAERLADAGGERA